MFHCEFNDRDKSLTTDYGNNIGCNCRVKIHLPSSRSIKK